MALHTLTEDGHLGWQCVGCGKQQTAHHSHKEVQWCHEPGMPVEHATVRLPACECGAQVYLKVHFTEQELKAPNMWIPWTSEHETMYQQVKHGAEHPEQYEDATESTLDILKSQVETLEAIRTAGGSHTNSHAIAQRHVELARQLKASGKHPKTGEENTNG